MNEEKVRVVEQLHSSVTNTVESLGEGLKVTASVTVQNGTVTSIDNICVTDPGKTEMHGEDSGMLWSGYANPTLGGCYYTQGREMEVLTAVIDFINAVRN